MLLKVDVIISNEHTDIQGATHLILPGVAAFGSAMEKIKKTIPLDIVSREVHQIKKPFLGICVGMQILADKGFEFEEYDGLGWISGEVKKIDAGELILPHVGWNELIPRSSSNLMQRIEGHSDVYFTHSYAFHAKDPSHIVAETKYGQCFPSVIQKDNICGVQFHPEKSQKIGMAIVKNFLSM